MGLWPFPVNTPNRLRVGASPGRTTASRYTHGALRTVLSRNLFALELVLLEVRPADRPTKLGGSPEPDSVPPIGLCVRRGVVTLEIPHRLQFPFHLVA